MTTKELIFENAHNKQGCVLAREYAKGSTIDFYSLPISSFVRLAELINKEILPLLADESYSMIKRLECSNNIEEDKMNGLKAIFLFCRGSYFRKREAISFNRDGFIGFCGELSGCNQTPFVKGFVKWVDELKYKDLSPGDDTI